MVAYYENYEALDKALKKVKTSEEALKIEQDLEQRNCYSEWIRAAYNVYAKLLRA